MPPPKPKKSGVKKKEPQAERVLRLWYEFLRLAYEKWPEAEDWPDEQSWHLSPDPDESYEVWRERTGDWFNTVPGAVTPLTVWPDLKQEVREGLYTDEVDDEYKFVFLADMRSSNETLVREFSEWLEDARDTVGLPKRKPGRASNEPVLDFGDYLPNRAVNVPAMQKALYVYKAQQEAQRQNQQVTGEQLWDLMARAKNPSSPYEELFFDLAIRAKGTAVGPVTTRMKRVEVSRHLKVAESTLDAVRNGMFPDPTLGPLSRS